MKSNITTKTLKIDGMTCINCQNMIEKTLRKTTGLQNVKVCYSKGTATVTYDMDAITLLEISSVIEGLDYADYKVLSENETKASNARKTIGLFII